MIGTRHSASSSLSSPISSYPLTCGIWISITIRSGANARALDGIAAVAHRLGDELMRPQQITEQLEIEFVVLDNEHPFCHVPPIPGLRSRCRRCHCAKQSNKTRTRDRKSTRLNSSH